MSNQLQDASLDKLYATFGKERVCLGEQTAGRSMLASSPSALLSVEKPAEIRLALSIAKTENRLVVTRAQATRIDRVACDFPGCLELDLQRMRGIEEINQDSLWLRAQAGTGMKQIADAAHEFGLRIEGLTNNEISGSLGGFLSTRARINDPITGVDQPVVLHVEAVLANGLSVRSVPAPRSAAGPDLFCLFLGTQGGLGVITSATLKLEPIPEEVQSLELTFRNLENALEFVRWSQHALLMPRELQICFGSQDSSLSVRLRLEGLSQLVGAALVQIKKMALQTNASIVENQAQPDTQAHETQQHFLCEIFVNWSMLFEVLQGIDSLFDGAWSATLSDVDLSGGSLRVNAKSVTPSESEDLLLRFVRLADPQQRLSKARAHTVTLLQKIRDELDPQRLLNPHAWSPGR